MNFDQQQSAIKFYKINYTIQTKYSKKQRGQTYFLPFLQEKNYYKTYRKTQQICLLDSSLFETAFNKKQVLLLLKGSCTIFESFDTAKQEIHDANPYVVSSGKKHLEAILRVWKTQSGTGGGILKGLFLKIKSDGQEACSFSPHYNPRGLSTFSTSGGLMNQGGQASGLLQLNSAFQR